MGKLEPNNKILPTRLPQWKDSRQKQNIQGDIRTLLRRDCEAEKKKVPSRVGCLRKYRDERRLTRSANLELHLIVIDDFEAG